MSTNINISVGDSKLLDQARLQQNASRQAQLEKEANQRLMRQAEIERVNALAAQGKDANGNPITALGTGPKPLRDEPAATRVVGEPYLLLRPDGTFDVNGDFATKTIGFFRKMGKSPFSGVNNDDLEYEPNGGPNNAPCVAIKLTQPIAPIGLSNTTSLLSKYYFPGSTTKYKQSITDYTLECFVKISDDYGNPAIGQRPPSVLFGFGVGFLGQANISVEFDRRVPEYYVGILCTEGDSSFSTQIFNQNYTLNSSPIDATAWHHYAVSRAGTTVRFFIDGVLMNAITSPYAQLTFTDMPSNSFFRFSGRKASTAEDPVDPGPIRMHGYRFTPKALYTASFTPPLNL